MHGLVAVHERFTELLQVGPVHAEQASQVAELISFKASDLPQFDSGAKV